MSLKKVLNFLGISLGLRIRFMDLYFRNNIIFSILYLLFYPVSRYIFDSSVI